MNIEKTKEKTKFAGDLKVGRWLFSNFETRFVEKTIHLIPDWLETYHLTMMTLIWSAIIALAGYLAIGNINWLWLVSVMIIFQYITDLFDGKIGKLRGTGLVKWGYFMDHFLDYIFLCSILIAYFFLVPGNYQPLAFATSLIIIGFMVNFYLFFAATNKFKISHFGIGPTESRLFFVVANTLIIFLGPERLLSALPFAAIIASIALVIVVFQSHKEAWKIDMEEKKGKSD